MRPWATRTAKTALLAAGFAAAAGGLSGVALAAGDAVSLPLTGSGLITLDVTPASAAAAVRARGRLRDRRTQAFCLLSPESAEHVYREADREDVPADLS